MSTVARPTRVELDIGGMTCETCATCAARIDKRLNRLVRSFRAA